MIEFVLNKRIRNIAVRKSYKTSRILRCKAAACGKIIKIGETVVSSSLNCGSSWRHKECNERSYI